ncbi:AAA family ATPase [Candidatus Peregrinibacteria bacterium]|jgi:adenylate kinase|nr:AAA family ATPase [Candidatus Peregrinibacteria bacterium]
MNSPKSIILAGPQGSGKGTVGKTIAERYGMQIFETGGKLREIAKTTETPAKGTPEEEMTTDQKIKATMERGDLVSNELIMSMVREVLSSITENGVIFDGIPRTPEQAKGLKILLDECNQQCEVVLIDIGEEETLKRLVQRKICVDCGKSPSPKHKEDSCDCCGGNLITRPDDQPEKIKRRLKDYREKTVPALNEFDDIIRINGEQSPEEVLSDVLQALDPILKQTE